MPTLRVDTKYFDELMGKHLPEDQLDRVCFQFGIEHEGIQDGEHKLDIANNRPDLLSPEGVTSALSMYLGLTKPLPHKIIRPDQLQCMTVLPQTASVRPFVSCAIMRGITFTKQVYDSFIKCQDKLHKTLCKQRSLASIGTHDLDTIVAPFVYSAEPPADILFKALNQKEQMPADRLFEQLQKDMFLKTYLPIIKEHPLFPVIRDSRRTVCSLPPIINGEHSKITLTTKNVLVEVTGTDRKRVDASLKCLVWAFARYCSEGVQQVQVKYPDGHSETTPEMADIEFSLHTQNVARIVGQRLQQPQIIACLQKMGLRYAGGEGQTMRVAVPYNRTDIMHEVDILEDIVIAYGYANVQNKRLQSSTVGKQNYLNKVSNQVRQQLAIAGYNEVLTFALCSTADMTVHLNRAEDKDMVKVGNPKNSQFEAGRTTLMAGIFKALTENKMHKLPMRLFEVGDVMVKDSTNETGCSNVRRLAAAVTDEVLSSEKSLFSLIHGLMDLLMNKFRIPILTDEGCRLKPSSEPCFLESQQAAVWVNGRKVGYLGVVHPAVLKCWDWHHPIALLQLDIEPFAQSIRL